MHTRGKPLQHGKSHDVVEREDQPEAGDGQAGRNGMTERFVLPMRLGNASGGKEPQFRTNVEKWERTGDWET